MAQIKNMGSLSELAGMLPGVKASDLEGASMDNGMLQQMEAIILSMTPYERENPSVLNSSRKKRIAAGSGTQVVDVNRLLKQFEMLQSLTKQFSGGRCPGICASSMGKKGGMMGGGMPGGFPSDPPEPGSGPGPCDVGKARSRVFHIDSQIHFGGEYKWSKIRLRRMGAKKAPFYRIVVADSRYPRDGRFIEEIGTYNPVVHPAELKVDADRAQAWIKTGAQPTETVRDLLKKAGAL